MSKSPGIIPSLMVLLLIAVFAIGWVTNIVKLAGLDWSSNLNIEAILRIVGVVVAPLGSVMGIFV